ncbi:MAG: YggS family pyridoxal phosphate-dependent enzyme [Bacillota bacterium]
MSEIADRLKSIRERIQVAAMASGRDPSDVAVVAITKDVGVEMIREAVLTGISLVGENRVQEARQKYAILGTHVNGREIAWHLVGHLQTNKVRHALDVFSLIHSLDSWRLACELERAAERKGRTVECLLEVNVSGKASRFGVEPAGALELAKQVSTLDRVKLAGVMAIAPVVEVKDEARPYFRAAREVFRRIRDEGLFRPGEAHLSMGMTQDFEVAVEEGATMVRIGTGIFGPRQRGVAL